MKTRLFTSWYPEKNPARREEILKCLRHNLESAVFEEVCLLLEGGAFPDISNDRLVVVEAQSRPTYEDFFSFANSRVTSTQDISVIANSDIYFDGSLSGLSETIGSDVCGALSRWDRVSNEPQTAALFDRSDSQDAWVFRGKIRPVVSDFCVGIPRCDNRILWELRQAGYEVINPAFSVRAYHLHAGQRSEYPAEIQGLHVPPPYAYLYPHNLMSLPRTILHNFRRPECRVAWRPDWRLLRKFAPWSLARRLARRLVQRPDEKVSG